MQMIHYWWYSGTSRRPLEKFLLYNVKGIDKYRFSEGFTFSHLVSTKKSYIIKRPAALRWISTVIHNKYYNNHSAYWSQHDTVNGVIL